MKGPVSLTCIQNQSGSQSYLYITCIIHHSLQCYSLSKHSRLLCRPGPRFQDNLHSTSALQLAHLLHQPAEACDSALPSFELLLLLLGNLSTLLELACACPGIWTSGRAKVRIQCLSLGSLNMSGDVHIDFGMSTAPEDAPDSSWRPCSRLKHS